MGCFFRVICLIYFLKKFYHSILSLLEIGFCNFYFFYIGLSQSHNLNCVFDMLTHVDSNIFFI
jgi:hypothetical protein